MMNIKLLHAWFTEAIADLPEGDAQNDQMQAVKALARVYFILGVSKYHAEFEAARARCRAAESPRPMDEFIAEVGSDLKQLLATLSPKDEQDVSDQVAAAFGIVRPAHVRT